MDSTKWWRIIIRLGLVLTLALSTSLLTACGGGGGRGGGAPAQADPANETNWDKLDWNTWKWG